MSHWVKAIANTVVRVDGRPFPIRLGMAFSSDDAVVRQHPDVFSDAPEPSGPAAVEQATRAPGEKSRARRG